MMSHIFAIALGGAFGAILRFLISTGVYSWLGRGFPYGTLTVNVIGSFLMGLLTASLVVEKMALSAEYKAALLVGFLGSLTTFSTFSLETVYLMEQGHFTKASFNVFVSISSCFLAVWVGLTIGKVLFVHNNGFVQWQSFHLPYALMTVSFIISLLMGSVMALLLNKVTLSMEYQAAIILIVMGAFLIFSSLYLFSTAHDFKTHFNQTLIVLIFNLIITSTALFLGWLAGKILAKLV